MNDRKYYAYIDYDPYLIGLWTDTYIREDYEVLENDVFLHTVFDDKGKSTDYLLSIDSVVRVMLSFAEQGYRSFNKRAVREAVKESISIGYGYVIKDKSEL